jgi:osmotically-inducible protein OsmY
MVMLSALLPIAAVNADTRADAWITTRAEAALHFVDGVQAGDVKVETVDGRVTLSGKVRSEKIKVGAGEGVWSVEDVVYVRNLLQVVGTGRDRRVQRSDNAILIDLRRVLRSDRSLDGSSIVVESVRRGVVVLGGTAATSNDIVRALRATSRRPGVRAVFSQVEGIADPAEAGLTTTSNGKVSYPRHDAKDAEDDVIRRGVTRALLDLDAQENADIRVLVTDGVVRLTGSVPTWEGNASRIHATRSVTGVRSILNELRVVTVNAGVR